MKLLLILLLPFASLAQTKKDNAIKIPATVTHSQIMTALVSSGYGIDKQLEGYYSTTSTQKKGTSCKFAIYLQDSVYILQGWMNQDMTLMGQTSQFVPIYFAGMKGSPMRNAWNEMVAIAGKLSSNIVYTKMD